MTIDYNDLFHAKPADVVRLARAIKIPLGTKSHDSLCKAVAQWIRKNPTPKLKNR